MKYLLIIFIIFLSCEQANKTSPAPTPQVDKSMEFSEYQGKMSWNAAVKKCKSLTGSWRLPGGKELHKALKAGTTEGWSMDRPYWTSESSTTYGGAYGFFLTYGGAVNISKYSELHVRCVH